jgi:hypothetical protein
MARQFAECAEFALIGSNFDQRDRSVSARIERIPVIDAPSR